MTMRWRNMLRLMSRRPEQARPVGQRSWSGSRRRPTSPESRSCAMSAAVGKAGTGETPSAFLFPEAYQPEDDYCGISRSNTS